MLSTCTPSTAISRVWFSTDTRRSAIDCSYSASCAACVAFSIVRATLSSRSRRMRASLAVNRLSTMLTFFCTSTSWSEAFWIPDSGFRSSFASMRALDRSRSISEMSAGARGGITNHLALEAELALLHGQQAVLDHDQ